jgi:hypothetical protein
MDTPTVQIPGFSYNVSLPNIGEGYAKGIETAGKGVAAGLHDVLDVATQNRNADDTLQAMNKAKILSDDAYNAVAGKSLGAKQTMLGLYAGQWVAQQAQSRELQKQGYGANLDVWKAHQAILDEYARIQATKPQTLPMNVQKPNRQQTPAPRAIPPGAAPPVQPAQPARPVQQPGQYAIGPTWTGALPQVYKSGSMPINGKPTAGILVPAQQSAPLGGQPVDWMFHPYG